MAETSQTFLRNIDKLTETAFSVEDCVQSHRKFYFQLE